MMTLEDAVDLVLHAFTEGSNGDIFVQKSPAATIDVLVKALQLLTKKNDHPISIIGTRHGEKLYETLCSREEMFVAEDQGNYYRIPSDNRELNYSKFIEEGDKDLTDVTDYNSDNTQRLDIEGMVGLLRKLDFINNIEKGAVDVPDGV